MTRSSVKVLSGPTTSVISKVDKIRHRFAESHGSVTGLLHSQDIDRVVQDSLDEEGEEMVADDAKKGIIPIRLVNKSEEQKHSDKMKAFEVVDRKEASGSKGIRTRWVVPNTGTPEKPNVRVRWVAQEFKWMHGPDSEALRSNSWTVTGGGRTESRCAGWKEQGSHRGSR